METVIALLVALGIISAQEGRTISKERAQLLVEQHQLDGAGDIEWEQGIDTDGSGDIEWEESLDKGGVSGAENDK